MLRSNTLRPLVSLAMKACPRQLNVKSTHHFTHSIASAARPLTVPRHVQSIRVQSALFKTSSIVQIKGRVLGKEFREEQEEHRHEKLKADPSKVSTTSTARKVFEFDPVSRTEPITEDPDMLRGIRSDLRQIRQTFALGEVPKEVFWVGMGGITPYVITSLSTLYLAWDISHATKTGMGFLVNKDTATSLLNILEPAQIGFGAIILSFLGAVHWGLEMAGYGGQHPYRRYTIGFITPALAWPTILLPFDYAMLVQFVGFVGMYFADSQATFRGWAPKWYSTYRFLLTLVVGGCIMMTLIGRNQIGVLTAPSQGARQHYQEIRIAQGENIQREEDKRVARMAAETKKIEESKERWKEKVEPVDPGKRAKGDQSGTQGIYSDKFQGPEKDSIQHPQPETHTKV